MFCGGVFAFGSNQQDIFVCSDGVEMTQKELLNICRGAMSLLYSSPLDSTGRRVLFVEAASTLLQKHGSYTFGVSTYHQQSIPLLCSIMARIMTLIKTNFPNELNLSNHHTRSIMFHAIKQLLGNNQGIIPSPAVTKSMDIIEDVNLKKPGSYSMQPVLSGQFVSIQQADELTSTDITSTLDSLATGAFATQPSSTSSAQVMSTVGAVEDSETGTVDFSLHEEVTFEAIDGKMRKSEVDIRVSALAHCKSDMGGVSIKLPPQPAGLNVRANPQIMVQNNEYFTCNSPTKELKEDTTIFAVQGTDNTPRDLPISIETKFDQNEKFAKITFNITSKYAVSAIIIGVEGNGLDPNSVSSQNSSVAPSSGANFILRPNSSIPAEGGTIESSFYGPLISPFVKPTFANVQCEITGTILADVKPEMKPGSNFIPGVTKKTTFIQKSIWPISQ